MWGRSSLRPHSFNAAMGRTIGIGTLAAVLLVLSAQAQEITRAALWAGVPGPAPGPTRIIGSAMLGCIAGAEELPTEGPGWQVLRPARDRAWGHPALIAFVRDLAARSQALGLPDLWIGDLSQPRGGPMTYGHNSHQAGLDADIWLDLTPHGVVPVARREAIQLPSMVAAGGGGVDPRRFTARTAALIRMAAESPGVDRIFVNPAIKLELCRMNPGAAWLRRVRPWWGHDQHMHVRIACPAGQPECRTQPPLPAGDGCDALGWWFTPEARSPGAAPPGPRPAMPAACAGVLAAR